MTQTPPKTYTTADIKRFRTNLKEEVDGAALYRRLASAEKDPNLSALYSKLAESEDRHLALWEAKLREAGAEIPEYGPSLRVKALGWVARRFGTQLVTPIVTRMEVNATAMYDDQPEAIEHGLPADERSHARIFREISRHGSPQRTPVNIAQIEGRHRGGTGNALRAAVLGVNDGLMSSVSLVMGVAGANPGRSFVLLTGIAGLIAGSFSMALGEWLSVRSSAESFNRQVEIERDELEMMPEEEEAELTLIYQAKGFTEAEARDAAKRIIQNPVTALDTLTREELGMSADEVGNAWVAGSTSFFLFGIGAILPVLPWIFIGGTSAVVASAVAAGLGLFLAGSVTTLFTGRSILFSGSRMLLFGVVAATVTFLIGKAIGVNAAG
ncbi:MAG: VIT1/CCC1 family protein [Tepidiformaceae bacterium]